jgi:phosphatidylinositol glycan class M
MSFLKINFAASLLIRLVFTIYGLYHDSLSENSKPSGPANSTQPPALIPKYTDVDYLVFTDAAEYVSQGESPYLRDTYRYTPLLAILLQPNVSVNGSFGKLLFILFDLICGYLIVKINHLNELSERGTAWALLFWFYNPITIAIASRGNAESLMAFLVLAFLYNLKRGRLLPAGLCYGLSVHFKIYPITYALAVAFYILDVRQLFVKCSSWLGVVRAVFCHKQLYEFFLSALGIFVLLTGLF